MALAASSLRWIRVSSTISAWAVSNMVVDHCSRVCRSSGELAPTSRATGIRLDCCWYWSRTSRPAIASWASSSRCPALTAALALRRSSCALRSLAAAAVSLALATASSLWVLRSLASATSSWPWVRATSTPAFFRAAEDSLRSCLVWLICLAICLTPVRQVVRGRRGQQGQPHGGGHRDDQRHQQRRGVRGVAPGRAAPARYSVVPKDADRVENPDV